MNFDLKDLAVKSKAGYKDSLMEFIERFTPLLKKYSKDLNYDGAYSDLEIALIETIHSLPLERLEGHTYMKEEQIVAYINKSIKSKYIKLSKQNRLIANKETELNLEITGVDYMEDVENKVFINYLLDKLTKLQRIIIEKKFIYGYTEVEIADQLHISKQAVNKTKKRALETLRSFLCV